VILLPDALFQFEEVSRFVLQMLRLKHSDLWSAYQHSNTDTINKNVSSIHLHFPITLHALSSTQSIKEEEELNPQSIEQLESLVNEIMQLSNTPASELMKDAFYYEQARYNLLQQVSWPSRKVMPPQLTLNEFKVSDTITVMTSSQSCIVKTQRDWRLALRLKELPKLKWIANSVIPDEGYTTLMVTDPDTGTIAEYKMDDLNELILEIFSTPKLLSEGFAQILEGFDADDLTQRLDTIKNSAWLRIYDLYILGSLHVLNYKPAEYA
jgi:hypothetical protein